MLKETTGTIYQCKCDSCNWAWESLRMPPQCPRCRTRAWNGPKRTGRPLGAKDRDPRPRNARIGDAYQEWDLRDQL